MRFSPFRSFFWSILVDTEISLQPLWNISIGLLEGFPWHLIESSSSEDDPEFYRPSTINRSDVSPTEWNMSTSTGWWSPDFLSSAISRLTFFGSQWNVCTTVGWIALKRHSRSHQGDLYERWRFLNIPVSPSIRSEFLCVQYSIFWQNSYHSQLFLVFSND